MFHYIFKDFQNMIKMEKFLVILLVCIQLMSTIVIYFSYGVTNHYNTQIGVTEGTDLAYTIQPINASEEYLSLDDIHTFHESIITLFEYKLEAVIPMCSYECKTEKNEKTAFVLSTIKYIDGKYTAGSTHFYDVVLPERGSDAYIYKDNEYIIEQFDSDNPVALVGGNLVTEENSILINETEFEIVGVFNKNFLTFHIYIPYSQLPEDGEYQFVGLTLSKPLLETEYEELVSVVEQCFGGKAEVCEEFNGIRNENQYRVYRGIILILAIFVVMSGLNYCVIYTHLLDKRRRMLAASRICGCTRFKALIIYIVELLSISIVTLIVGLLIFIYAIMPNVKATFEYMEYYFNSEVYVKIALAYIGVLTISYLAIVLRYVKKTPVRLVKEE